MSEKRTLSLELVQLSRKVEADMSAIDRLKDKLKAVADTQGSFREAFPDGSTVHVKAAAPGKFKGMLPILDPELFLAADKAEQDRLTEGGLVRIESQYGRGSYASVTVTLPGTPSA